MYIITWSELHSLNPTLQDQFSVHKASTCNKDSALALHTSLSKDIRTIEAFVRDEMGNLVPGGFFQKA